jgi:5'(3')-deoxyribonucleotidase
MNLRIGVDVDGVIADLHKEWLRRYNRDFNDDLTSEEITEWAIDKFVRPIALEKNEDGLPHLFAYLADEDLYKYVPPIAKAREGCEYIRRRGHDVVFVSSCVRGQADQKVEWMIRHKFIKPMRGDTLLDFVAASDKSLIAVQALIDDRDKNLRDSRAGTIRVLFDSPWNRNTAITDYDLIMYGWNNIEETVDAIEHAWNKQLAGYSTDVG